MKQCVLGDHVSWAGAGSVRPGMKNVVGLREEVRVVGVGALDGVTVAPSEVEYCYVSGGGSDAARLRAGDVLISARGAVGKVAVVHDEIAGALVSANIFVLRLKKSLLPAVLWAYLVSPRGRQALDAVTLPSSAQKAISLDGLLAMKIPVPPMSVQCEMASAVENGLRSYRAALQSARLRLNIVRHLFRRAFEECEDNGGDNGNS